MQQHAERLLRSLREGEYKEWLRARWGTYWVWLRARWAEIRAAVRARPFDAALVLGAVVITFYVVAYPFMVVHLPPMTDMPFHAAAVSILRHYLDPAYHFREQFTIHPLETPYVSMYVLGALFALVMPIQWAAKLMGISMLVLLPAGLAVLFWGMKKSPLWGILGLGMVWCMLTQWGFLNYMGAIGLFAMVVGCTLLLLDRPTTPRAVGLSLALLAVFITHIFRFPFAVAAVVGTTILMYPATRRVKPILLPLVPPLVVFGAWRLIRPAALGGGMGPLDVHKERLQEIPQYLFHGYIGTEEQRLAEQMMKVSVAVIAVAAILFVAQMRWRGRSAREWCWGVGVTLLPLILGGVFLLAYLVLPMSIGDWWFVYPREVTTAVFALLGVAPDLPRQWWLRAPLLAAIALTTGQLALYTAEQWHAFDDATADFERIVTAIPPAPKLMYLVFDHSGSAKQVTPFIHLPAWVQAEKGGWLSFQFIAWNASPIRYREHDPNVPPPRPTRWEWTPERFDLKRDAPWFDTFLVRKRDSADALFAGDPSIKPVAHVGTWWLYRRARE
jgi:hypothetical protein